jgi:hypothetical protein
MTRRSETRIPPASSAIGVKSLESSPKPLQAYGGASLLRECTFLHKKTECFRQRNQSPHKRAGMMSITEQFTLTTRRVKMPRKEPLCEHKRRRNLCKECGGSGLCEHTRQRSL